MKTILTILTALILATAGPTAGSDPETLENSKETKKACKADYKKHCKKVKKGGGRIITCLREHDAELSAGCKAALSK
jgi:hypothetical protein